jgi:uncharacterized DUF497 family protein
VDRADRRHLRARNGRAESFAQRGSIREWYNSYTKSGRLRFEFDRLKSAKLRSNPKGSIGFEEAQDIFERPYYQDRVCELPEQYRAIGWVGLRLYTLIFELREDEDGEFYRLVTLWNATREERKLYEEHS